MTTNAANPDQTPRHGREQFFIEGEGIVGSPPATGVADLERADGPTAAPANAGSKFRFSRIGPKGRKLPKPLRIKIANAMTAQSAGIDGSIPAGYTYLGQFVDHDLTFDKTDVMLGDAISPADMLLGRSPTLDLDSLYGAGPNDPRSENFYKADGLHLKMGSTIAAAGIASKPALDLPREGPNGKTLLIPDHRNDENLFVAQTHLAMIKFHNHVLNRLGPEVPAAKRFNVARRRVVRHYQWMLRTDFLPRICDAAVVDDVFTNGRKIHSVNPDPLAMPTMPVEFSVAAFRFGHSMIREAYDWNREFPGAQGTLGFLFLFSGTSGDIGKDFAALPSNWIVDWRRHYRFASIDRDDLKPPPGAFNKARRIDTKLTQLLGDLPVGSFGGKNTELHTIAAHLAFRNLTRAGMVKLASGQQMAAFVRAAGVSVTTLTANQIAGTGDGAALGSLTPTQRARFLADTPLWFYILREAELNGGKLTGVGARIVAETFHRAIEGSRHSILRNPAWRPDLSGVPDRFTMMDLLLVAFEDDIAKLAPLGN